MASAAQCSAYLTTCIRESLSLHLYDNARWLGERLVALAATEANITLLATCYYQANQVNRAYHVLKTSGLSSHPARYLHALCCIKLGKLNDAREVLTKFGEQEVPHGAAGLYLLGRVYRQVGRSMDAKEQFVRALRVNPLLWCAFEELCALGGENEAQEIATYAAFCSTALLQVQQQQQPTQAPGAASAVPRTLGPKDLHPSDAAAAAPPMSATFMPAPPAATNGHQRTPVDPTGQQQHQGQQSGSVTHLPPPSSAFTAAYTPITSDPANQLTLAAQPNNTHAFPAAHGGSWEARGCPPPPPVCSHRSSATAAAAAAPALAADTPSTHRPAAQGKGPAGSGLHQQQQPRPAATFSAGSMHSDASHLDASRSHQDQVSAGHPGVSCAELGEAGEGSRQYPYGPVPGGQQQPDAHCSQYQPHAHHPQHQQLQPSPSSFATPIVGSGGHSHYPVNHSTTTNPSAAAAALFVTPHMMDETPQSAPFVMHRGLNYTHSAGLAGRRRSEEVGGEGIGKEERMMMMMMMMEEEARPRSAGGGAFVTPGVTGSTLVPPAPPQKNMEAMGQLGFLDYSGNADSAFRASERAQQALYHGHHEPRHQTHVVDDRGKVRKISGKSLFHESASVQGVGLSSGSSSIPRRSSRLAAQQATQGSNAQSSIPLDATGPMGASVAPAQTQLLSQGQQQQPRLPVSGCAVRSLDGFGCSCQSQNQPDPLNPPLLPTHTQTTFEAKLAYQPGCMPRTSFAQLAAGQEAGASDRSGSFMNTEGQVLCMALLHPAYQGVLHLAMYRCNEALQCFQSLQPQQARTAWVWCQVARAYFERMDYSQAAHAFENARQLDKQHVEGMEVYSTVLWHLKRETDLSYLAQDLIAVDRLAPQTWCVLGNFFSLQKEHEAALRLFERALQLDPSFTYAYTLSGHEHAANDDLDSALTCYRNALRLDGRHYNAMYGMGQLYFRQEKFDIALVHFKCAAVVNPQSSVLRCYWGMALAKQGILNNALSKLQEAVDLDPRNPLARYEKAGVLAASGTDVGMLQAVAELEALKSIAPGEASIYFQMGKLYKRLGKLKDAQEQLEMALSLNSASSADTGLIKTSIEKLSVNDEEEEEEL